MDKLNFLDVLIDESREKVVQQPHDVIGIRVYLALAEEKRGNRDSALKLLREAAQQLSEEKQYDNFIRFNDARLVLLTGHEDAEEEDDEGRSSGRRGYVRDKALAEIKAIAHGIVGEPLSAAAAFLALLNFKQERFSKAQQFAELGKDFPLSDRIRILAMLKNMSDKTIQAMGLAELKNLALGGKNTWAQKAYDNIVNRDAAKKVKARQRQLQAGDKNIVTISTAKSATKPKGKVIQNHTSSRSRPKLNS